MSTATVVMPRLGESVDEGTISKWLVRLGDRINELDPLAEVDSDKVSTEVPSPVSGVVLDFLAVEGQTVKTGTAIALVNVLDTEIVGPGSRSGAARSSDTAARTVDGTEGPVSRGAIVQMGGNPTRVETSRSPEHIGVLDRHKHSPAVRSLASELNIDLSSVTGSGTGGRVTRNDVRAFHDRTRSSLANERERAQGHADGDTIVRIDGARKLMVDNVALSKRTVPHAWQVQEVDMSGVLGNCSANQAGFQEREGFPLEYPPYVMAAAVSGLREHPYMNATFNQTEIIVHSEINLNVLIGSGETVAAPVVRRADRLSIAGIARAVNDLTVRARARLLRMEDLEGGTFTLDTAQSMGRLFSYSVINPTQAAVLTVESVVERPVALAGMIGIRPMMYLCLSLDHRVVDGLQAARFVTSCREWLERVTPDTAIY